MAFLELKGFGESVASELRKRDVAVSLSLSLSAGRFQLES